MNSGFLLEYATAHDPGARFDSGDSHRAGAPRMTMMYIVLQVRLARHHLIASCVNAKHLVTGITKLLVHTERTALLETSGSSQGDGLALIEVSELVSDDAISKDDDGHDEERSTRYRDINNVDIGSSMRSLLI